MYTPQPPLNRDMTVLDRSKFTVSLGLAQARFPDPKYIARFAKECKADILQLRSINHVQKTEDNGRAVLLRHDLDLEGQDQDFSAKVLSQLTPKGQELLKEANAELCKIQKDLDYDFWRTDEIFYSVLPVTEKDEIPSGFSMVGHVAHINLRSEWKAYDKLIGQVILDKNPRVKTVVNKVDSIDTKFRTFKMDVLAGEDNTEVEQHESGCRFQFDFAKVYWNSRLHTEHDRLVSLFRGEASSRERKQQERAKRENHEKSSEVVDVENTPATAVCDVFAGVGPFAVPSGRTSLFVMANDLNPYSYEALEHNVKLNKVSEYVQCFNLDGAEYVQQSMKLLDEHRKKQPTINPVQVRKRKAGTPVVKQDIPDHYSHYVMNLPDSAIEFLWSFKGLYTTVEGLSKDTPLPHIHVHCFHKWEAGEEEPSKEETKAALLERVYKQIDVRLDPNEVGMHWVRKVSPKKDMFCISFELPKEVAWAQQVKQ